MFKKLRGKRSLQELERDFNIETLRLGDLELQMNRLSKAKAQCLQRLENLNKEGVSLKKKGIADEIQQKVENGDLPPPEEKEDEIH